MTGAALRLNDENFDQELGDGVTLVDFYADWCGPCRMMEPIIEELANEMSGSVKIAKIDIDASQKVTARFNVTSIPTLILFKNHEEIERIVGVKDKKALKSIIQAAL